MLQAEEEGAQGTSGVEQMGVEAVDETGEENVEEWEEIDEYVAVDELLDVVTGSRFEEVCDEDST